MTMSRNRNRNRFFKLQVGLLIAFAVVSLMLMVVHYGHSATKKLQDQTDLIPLDKEPKANIQALLEQQKIVLNKMEFLLKQQQALIQNNLQVLMNKLNVLTYTIQQIQQPDLKFEITNPQRQEFISDAITNLLYDHDNPANIISAKNNSIPKESDVWKDVSLLIDIVCQHEYNKECDKLDQLPFWPQFYNGKDPFVQ